MKSAAKNFTEYALSIGSIELVPEGRKLKSGRISYYFFNSGLFRTGEALWYLTSAYASAIHQFKFEIVFGPAYKGIPLSTGTAMALYKEFGINMGYSFNRKEEKDHGEGGTIIGESMNEKIVCIVDDVMTAGGTARESVKIVRDNGGIVAGYAIAFDRQEQGTGINGSAVDEFMEEYQIPVVAAATAADLIEVLMEKNHPILPKILEYQNQYGVR